MKQEAVEMPFDLDRYPSTSPLFTLREQLNHLRLTMEEQFNNLRFTMENQIRSMEHHANIVHAEMERLTDEKYDQRIEIHELNEKIRKLQTEVEVLREAHKHSEEAKRENVRALEAAASYLDQCRSKAAFTLDSPMSPAHAPPGPSDRT